MAYERDDFIPIIVGGDTGTYAMAREFHEAYGVKSYLLNPGFIATILNSKICVPKLIPDVDKQSLLEAIEGIGRENSGKQLLLLSGGDQQTEALVAIRPKLPAYACDSCPSKEALAQVIDKTAFMELASRVGLSVPQTEYYRVGDYEKAPDTGLSFPLVAKPAVFGDFGHLIVHGFKKIHFIRSREELESFWTALRESSFEDEILLQELIEGDDSYRGSLTFYFDHNAELKMFAGAQVLLEDHSDARRGNSLALISRPMDELKDEVAPLFAALNYQGFAQIDLKLNPRDNRWYYFDFNPRIGGASYSVVAAGVNPAELVVRDLIDHEELSFTHATRKAVFSLVPRNLLHRYLRNPELLAEVKELEYQGLSFNPQHYERDRGLKRMLNVYLTEFNHYRKFRRFYPKATESSF